MQVPRGKYCTYLHKYKYGFIWYHKPQLVLDCVTTGRLEPLFHQEIVTATKSPQYYNREVFTLSSRNAVKRSSWIAAAKVPSEEAAPVTEASAPAACPS